MTTLLPKLRAMITVHYAEGLQYRAELILWILSNLLPFILMGVWMQAGLSGRFGSMTAVDFARYFFAAFIVRNLTLVWVVWDFEQDVVTGTLSHQLLHPIDPGWRYLARHLAERLTRLPFLAIFIVAFFLIYPTAIWTLSISQVLIAAAAIGMTFTMRYIVQYAFAMLAFWTERAHAIEQLWFLPYMFLSGMVAPLELYPQALRDVLPYTPFPYLIWFPVRVLLGDEVNLPLGFAVMTFWTIVAWTIYRLLWRAGLKRYSAMGA
ncbi:MAG: multidrug ABC transporter permease [Phycisphaera sp.]|nr:multidrug ABC transporter permease [Phycisphaera sp.]